MYDPAELWGFLPVGFGLTILVEATVLMAALSARHGIHVRLFSGIGLTSATYPIVILVMPLILMSYGRVTYLAVAEVFAPLAECMLFLVAFGCHEQAKANRRDCLAIIAANIASFLIVLWCFP